MGKHKEWRKLAKKARRKRIRQKLAQELNEKEEEARFLREQSPNYQTLLEELRKAQEFQEQEETRIAAIQEAQWLEIEQESCKRWKKLQEKLELAKEERLKQAARIKEEWEREQKRLKLLKKQKEEEEQEKIHKQEELQLKINNFIENGGELPEDLKQDLESNPLKPTCPFFEKTGACRFKDTCSRNHVRPGISRVLLIPNFYSHYSLQQLESEYGNDNALEFDHKEIYNHFKDFFYDVLPEIEKCGIVKQFKVCCNHEMHLRGNVYVEYSNHREAIKSYRVFQGRWYGGKQLNVEFCRINSWKSAICGLHMRHKCPKGTSCNFLHVFKNPGNMFAAADRDLHYTPPNDLEESYVSDARHWRWSESPERIPVKHSSDYKRRKSREESRRRVHRRYKDRKRHRSRSKSRHKYKLNRSHRQEKLSDSNHIKSSNNDHT